MRIDRALVAVLTAAAVATGGAGCSSSPAAPALPADPTPVATTAPPVPTVLGPTGYGNLRLGMNKAQAEASGEIESFETTGEPPGCGTYTAYAGWKGFTKDGEIVAIMPGKSRARTPEGIGIGSTAEEIRTAYPTLKLGYNWSSAEVPGANARYGFLGITLHGSPQAQVTQMLLYNDKDTCHN